MKKYDLDFVKQMIHDPKKPISELLNGNKLDSSKVREAFNIKEKDEMGIYSFWWIGDEKELPNRRPIVINGPGHQPVNLHWDIEDFPTECRQKSGNGCFPLYVGKTTKFVGRLSLHLSLGIKDWKSHPSKKGEKLKEHLVGGLKKHTTSCQFRSGLEHLFPDSDFDTIIGLLKNVAISFHCIPKAGKLDRHDIKDRFYVEDLAVGYYRPWFNVDSER
jgi:hypothetical protein